MSQQQPYRDQRHFEVMLVVNYDSLNWRRSLHGPIPRVPPFAQATMWKQSRQDKTWSLRKLVVGESTKWVNDDNWGRPHRHLWSIFGNIAHAFWKFLD